MAISHVGQMSLAVTTMPFRTIRSISIAAGVARSSGDQLSSEVIHGLILGQQRQGSSRKKSRSSLQFMCAFFMPTGKRESPSGLLSK